MNALISLFHRSPGSRLVAAGAALLLAGTIGLQAQDELPEFNTIRTPPSPAFTLLGVEPSSVERPNTPSSLAFAILEQTSLFSRLPEDYSLEVSPYWLFGRPRLTWRDDTIRSIGQSISRTGTISIATTQLGDSVAPITGVALGARLSLFSGRVGDESKRALEGAEATLTTLSLLLKELADKVITSAEWKAKMQAATAGMTPQDAAVYIAKQENLVRERMTHSSEYVDAADAVEEELEGLSVAREGLLIEFAGGASWKYPENDTDSARLLQAGVWVTPSYVDGHTSIVGVGRFLVDDDSATANTLELGGRVIYSVDALAVSIEYLQRLFMGDDAPGSQYRLAGGIDYKIFDNTWANISFGRDDNTPTRGNLFAQFGVSFNINDTPYELP